MTFFVAASDASDSSKARADYLATDYSSDDQAIQAAIDALPAGGGKVGLSEGNFDIAATVQLSPYHRLQGQGKSTVLKAVASLDSDLIDTPTGQDNRYVEILDLKLDGNRANNASGKGIRLFGARECLIQRVWMKNLSGVCVHFDGDGSNRGWFNWVDHCEFDLSDSDGILETWTEQNFVTYNVFSRLLGRGFYANSDKDLIQGNVFDFITGVAITAAFGAGGWRIKDNHIDNSENRGIWLQGADKCQVQGNIFGSGPSDKSAIYLSDNVERALIQHNQLGGTSGWREGIKESSATVDCRYEHNNLSSPAAAMNRHAGSTGGAIHHNAGYVTENSGTATLVNGQTSIVVTHGLAVTPVAGDIMVTPMESLGAASEFYIDTYTATQFTIHVDVNPTQDVAFAWKAMTT